MKILIIENEIYLAQSITTKLSQFGFVCEIVSSIDEALKFESMDIILLSSNIPGQNFYPVIEKFKSSIIIMMIPYINDDTVTNPLKSGTSDYIVKPFMMDELIRKIDHYIEFYQLQKEITFYRDYFCNSLLMPAYTINTKVSFPLIIKSVSQKAIDMCVVNYAIHKKFTINFISLYKDATHYKGILKNAPKTQLTYVVGFETLPKEEKEECVKALKNIPVMLSCLGGDVSGFKNIFEINIKEIAYGFQDDVISVDEYIKTMILKFEDRYPDTELSKRLGMSRKSLWEKRKKYGITKKK
ncbi:response regulator [Helicobacter sp.]|uniref:response regulator n=1 Tax=Helicobacter sp. TaxID=218 RepID=UPI0025C6A2FF|nr:response regulator [Helicobacter sp.]MCI5968662.1 response regulator [Helicobacter sp.]MDY2584484.1 response regulator [Helicobacter sp.]